MKKLLCVLLAAALILGLAACGEKPGPSGNASEPAESASAPGSSDAATLAPTGVPTLAQTEDTAKKYKKTVTVSTGNAIGNLNPWQLSNNSVYWHQNFVYNELVSYNWDEEKFVPELATEWKQEKPNVWYFKLRDDVYFSNGEQFTADDVKFSLLDGPAGGEEVVLTAWKNIEDIEIISDFEVRVILKGANSEYLYTLYTPQYGGFMVNRDAYLKDGVEGLRIGTGGWIVTDFMPLDSVTYKKFEDSWVWKEEGETPTETVIYKYVADSVVACLAGEVANANPTMADALGYIAEYKNVIARPSEALAYDVLIVNCSEYSIFYEDFALRRAVAYAIDRAAYNKIASSGMSDRLPDMTMKSMWTPAQFGYFDDYEHPYGFDLEYAKELLAQSKHAGEKITLDLYSLKGMANSATVIAEMLKELGIECKIVATDSQGLSGAYSDAKTQHVYDLLLTNCTYTLNPSTHKSRFCNGGYRNFYVNPEADRLFALIEGGETEEIRLQACKDMQILWYNEMPFIVLKTRTQTPMWNVKVSGIDFSLDQKYDFHRVMWEED